jgi:hypothetical protein
MYVLLPVLTPGTNSCADAMPVIAKTPATPVTAADPSSKNPRGEISLLLLLSLLGSLRLLILSNVATPRFHLFV